MTEHLIALFALAVMEIVLGIDNIVFISILTAKLPEKQRPLGRYVGLALAAGMRVLLLLVIKVIIGMVEPFMHLTEYAPQALHAWLESHEEVNAVSVRDLILFGGGLFLIWTSVREIHHKIEGDEAGENVTERPVSLTGVLVRIGIMDLIFSLDSVITAVGMAEEIWVMISAIVLSVVVMIVFANQVSDFVQRHATVKMLALSFLLLIGTVLISEAAGTPIQKGYVYFAMGFSLAVEMLNLRMKMKRLRPKRGEGEVGVVRDSN